MRKHFFKLHILQYVLIFRKFKCLGIGKMTRYSTLSVYHLIFDKNDLFQLLHLYLFAYLKLFVFCHPTNIHVIIMSIAPPMSNASPTYRNRPSPVWLTKTMTTITIPEPRAAKESMQRQPKHRDVLE